MHPASITKKPLIVLNASAGSGKTRNLVKSFLELLINNESPESSFKHILAMTFTNKAAREMKERIITALHEISTGKTEGKNYNIAEDLSEELNLPLKVITERSKKILDQLLHQYEEFHVMTIDKFNLRLIKSFSRDLDLPVDFEVVLEEDTLLENTVDQLLSQLGSKDAHELNKLILSYAESNLEEEAQWNFRNSLIEFAKILTKETNFPLLEKLENLDFSMEELGRLKSQKRFYDQAIIKEVTRLRRAIENNDLIKEKLPGKGNTLSGINNIAELQSFPVQLPSYSGTVEKNLDVELKNGQDFPNEIKDPIRAILSYWENNISEYAALHLYLKNFYNMALLKYMADALKKMRKDEQLIRISEFNLLISELIRNENTPFIYERLGNKYHHYLLDEFQDTSRLQWMNLIPLVQDSLGNNNKNLIVGDPKQSIYRFKNGLAEQFVVLPKLYNPEKDDRIEKASIFFDQMGKQYPLEDNWRSAPSIVNFNNAFFKSLKNDIPAEIASYYSSIHQTPKKELNGKIRIKSQEVENKPDDSSLVEQIIEWINEAITDGYRPHEICILGSRNGECNTWAIELTDRGYRVVSSDSLLIMNQLYVKLAKAYLQCRWSPQGETEQKQFVNLYFRCLAKSYSEYNSYFDVNEDGRRKFNFNRFVHDHFDGPEKFFFNYENLYDLIEGFYRLLNLEELDDPYLHHFADVAYEFNLSKGPDLKGFLDHIEQKKDTLAVQVPESENAIRIMTMHKSKGLEFPVVIVPNIDFSLDIKSPLLAEVDKYVVYKRPKKDDVLLALSDLYQRESNQILGDRLNLCYVTFTRPKEQLYILNQFQKGKSTRFGRMVHETIKKLYPSQGDTIDLLIEDGARNSSPDSMVVTNSFEPENISDKLWFPDIALQNTDELEENDYLNEQRLFGREFHYIISKKTDSISIEECLHKAQLEGEISSNNKDRIKKLVEKTLSHEPYLDLKKDAVNIYFEQSIIDKGGKIVRPDQVIELHDKMIIVDFKTGHADKKNQKQVHEYVLLVKDMTGKPVEGYLLYADENEIRLEQVD